MRWNSLPAGLVADPQQGSSGSRAGNRLAADPCEARGTSRAVPSRRTAEICGPMAVSAGGTGLANRVPAGAYRKMAEAVTRRGDRFQTGVACVFKLESGVSLAFRLPNKPISTRRLHWQGPWQLPLISFRGRTRLAKSCNAVQVSTMPRRGLEPPRGVIPTRPSTWRVCQFRHLGFSPRNTKSSVARV